VAEQGLTPERERLQAALRYAWKLRDVFAIAKIQAELRKLDPDSDRFMA
jgi:hypothetical protein